MGMTRSGAADHTFWTGPERTNPLYGTRYVVDALRRDDPERALVSFYGMLAHGFTRNTFVGGEEYALEPLDEGGRLFYCPPNSAANSHFLAMLRYLLLQDFDLDDDGMPETLRLLFATPKRWCEDGKRLDIENAPTAFGRVSIHMTSRLSQGLVEVQLDPPQRNRPKKSLLRVRVPEGWTAVSAEVTGGGPLDVDSRGTVDVSRLSHPATIRFQVERTQRDSS